MDALFTTENGAVAESAPSGKPGSAAEHTMRGEVLRIVFSSSDGQYVVLRMLDNEHREHTLVGALGGLLEGQDIEAAGHWETHKEHGRQFRVTRFRALLPTTAEGIRRYLASGLIPGIGPKFAARIVAAFGAETLAVLDQSSARLRQVPGLGKKRIAEIRRAWKEHAQYREVQVFLQGLGLSPAYCARVIQRYGAAAAEVVRRNPYQLASDIRGIGFLSADRIARRLGIEPDNPLRLAAGVAYVLEKLADDGHTCYPRDELGQAAADMLSVAPAAVATGLDRAFRNGTIIADPDDESEAACVYPRRLFLAETGLAESLHALSTVPSPIGSVPAAAFDANGTLLNDAQEQALRAAFAAPVSIITGGPGVGKTTVVGEIVATARRLGRFVMLAAPTGRAAKRLTESSGSEAKTVHRLLKWDPNRRAFVHNRDRPLRCDLLVLDEVSMLDVVLAQQLLEAVQPGTHLILVGDRDQLPSVGPGTVLNDMILSKTVPVTQLTEIFRQARDSRIVLGAHAVNRGDMPDLRRPARNRLTDFYWIDEEDPERVAELIERLVAERIPKRFHFDPLSDIQILSPMHRGSCGAVRLNAMLQARLNRSAAATVRFGERLFRTGDRVMQTVNNYDKGVFNGELGQIVAIHAESKSFRVSFDVGVVDYAWHEADQIQLAYAITVHKSQGCEFPAVVMPLLTQHYVMLQRNLLYTGMTRARRLLVLVGTRKALAIAIRNNQPLARCTRLAQRLRALAAAAAAPDSGLQTAPRRSQPEGEVP